MSLLTGEPRSATVRARGFVEVAEIVWDDLAPLVRRRPEIADRVAELMVAREATDTFLGLSGHSTEAHAMAERIRANFAAE